jgi:SPP1 family predicted phage head-tail adaptor
MNPGKLDKRVLIQLPELAQASDGQPVTTWVDAATAWASIEPLSGREWLNAQAVQDEVTHRVRMRWNDALAPEGRLLYGERVLHIRSVINRREAGRWAELMCAETTGNG